MADQRILAVEDEEDILELVRYNLTREGYSVITASSGEQALKTARAELPDLIVLDLLLPGLDGLEVTRLLKRDPATENIPIVMLTAKGEESDIVAGLELGADDYITKPFSPKVLVARIRAVLRRRTSAVPDPDSNLACGDLVIQPRRREVLLEGRPVELTHTEFEILHFLARRPGWVFTRDQIVEAARGELVVVTPRSVDVHVVSLRRKLGSCADYVETVRGVGYRFKDLRDR